MKDERAMRIAGSKTTDHWKSLRRRLIAKGDPEKWKEAFEDFFLTRLSTRYFEPIGLLQTSKALRGEGFSIVAIQCTLIEFLAATVKGSTYRYRGRSDGRARPHEYSDSGELFAEFLANEPPFCEFFSKSSARDFYTGVRCGLLHEARTKNGWSIRAKANNGEAIDATRKIVYRDTLHKCIVDFVHEYGMKLRSDAQLQEALVRKFDNLCE